MRYTGQITEGIRPTRLMALLPDYLLSVSERPPQVIVQPTPQRILIIRPSALGDVCRSVPVLASLRNAFPASTIDWVVQEEFAPAIEAHPALSEVIAFPRARFHDWWRNPRTFAASVRWLGHLRRRHYDLVIDCQGLGRSGLMCFATRSPRRVGLRRTRELAWLTYTIRVPRNAAAPVPRHTVDQMLLLIEDLGIEVVRDMRLYIADQYRTWWVQKRKDVGIDAQPYVVLAPTARWVSKRWPIDRFAQLIEPLHMRGYRKFVVIGSPSEREQVRGLVEPPAPGVIDLVGQTNIAQTMALIADAALVIANDSAPLHMAVGFDRPCVGLFGPTDPAAVGPYQRDDCVVRGYHPGPGEAINYRNSKLGDSLMRFISTAAVLQKIDAVLAGEAAHRSNCNAHADHGSSMPATRATP